jgi:Homeodomain-like domain
MFVHAFEVRQAALDLVAQGVNDCEISRRLGVPRETVRDWRAPRYVPNDDARPRNRWVCFRCWRPTSLVLYTPADYAELLGLYLGDGHITQMARAQRLRLMLDAKYPTIVDDAADLIARVVPWNDVGRQFPHEGRMVTLFAYHRHWSCLFPQHGPGKKHERPIILEPWQEGLVEAAPWALLRGLIRSDGCVYINRTGKYEYESYEFANCSKGILELFVATCASVGVECRRYDRHARIYRRASVTLMLEHVGRKF